MPAGLSHALCDSIASFWGMSHAYGRYKIDFRLQSARMSMLCPGGACDCMRSACRAGPGLRGGVRARAAAAQGGYDEGGGPGPGVRR